MNAITTAIATSTRAGTHFTVDAAALKAALTHACRVIPRRVNYGCPILNDVRLSATIWGLTVAATDLDIETTSHIAANTSVPGGFTVGAHALLKLLKTCSKGALVTFETSVCPHPQQAPSGRPVAQTIVTMRCGAASYSLETRPEANYPAFANSEPTHSYRMQAQDLLRLLDQTAFAMSTEETRYYLNGIYLHVKASPDSAPRLTAVATDGHVMAICDTAAPEGSVGSPGIIIPRLTVETLQRRLKGVQGSVGIEVSGTRMELSIALDMIHSKVIDGSYPDYMRVMPKDNDKCLTVNRSDVLAAVKAVSAAKTTNGAAVKLTITSSKLTLSAADLSGTNDIASLDMPCVWCGLEPFVIGFNYKYLVEVFVRLGDAHITLCFSDVSKPVLITEGDTAFVCMPMAV